jgi:hypothetical protein
MLDTSGNWWQGMKDHRKKRENWFNTKAARKDAE